MPRKAKPAEATKAPEYAADEGHEHTKLSPRLSLIVQLKQLYQHLGTVRAEIEQANRIMGHLDFELITQPQRQHLNEVHTRTLEAIGFLSDQGKIN